MPINDIQLQVFKYIEKNWDFLTHTIPGMVRLIIYDGHNKLIATIKTGTKNVAKTMKHITEGTVKDRGTKWFPELSAR